MVAEPGFYESHGIGEDKEDGSDESHDHNDDVPSSSDEHESESTTEDDTPSTSPTSLVPMVLDQEDQDAHFNPPTSVKAEYKEVVIIGNGPSAITLSYFLSGNWPYYNGQGESVDEMLHYRLQHSASSYGETHQKSNPSLVEQDLAFLAQGLEGRSSNPVALLFDILNHPYADLGLEQPSLLDWKRNQECGIDHVVIGKGLPGGAWQSMDGDVLTISRGRWMELPNSRFRDWEAQQESKCQKESRATVASVAQYYRDYVGTNGLKKYFKDNSVVTEVSPCRNRNLPKYCDTDTLPDDLVSEHREDRRVRRYTISEIPVADQTFRKRTQKLWKVKGYSMHHETNTIQPFTYITRNLVLATGTTDLPNILNVKGENLPFVLHSLNELESLISSGHLNEHCDPVLVVGAGLSAADAIIAARFHSIPVVHVYRRNVDDKNLIFKRLPVNMYPEYHKVFQMMQYPGGYEGYKVLEQHVVNEILPGKRVRLAGPNNSGVLKVSCVVICIGSHPDLSFLGETQFDIGVHPGMPIDCKRNPVAINYATHECVRQPGLYALGPLVGENFVRFLQGGSLAVTTHLVKQKQENDKT